MSEVEVIEPVEVLVPLDVKEAERLDKRLRLMAGTARENFEKVGRLIDETKRGRVHDVLGFRSWTAYLADAVGGRLQLSGDARVAMVEMLAGEGMSIRAIAAATGVSKSTVDRDLAQASRDCDGTADAEGAPDSTVPQWDSTDGDGTVTVTGLNDKTYSRMKRKPRAKKEAAPEPEPTPEPQHEPTPVPELVAEPEPAQDDAEPDPEPEVKAERKVQIPTAYRDTVKKLNPIVSDLVALTRDPRWGKATGRFTFRDRDTLDRHITALQVFRDAMGEGIASSSSSAIEAVTE